MQQEEGHGLVWRLRRPAPHAAAGRQVDQGGRPAGACMGSMAREYGNCACILHRQRPGWPPNICFNAFTTVRPAFPQNTLLGGYCKGPAVQEALAAANKDRTAEQPVFIVLAPLQLSGGMLPAALEAELVQAGLLVQQGRCLRWVTDPLPYTIVFRVRSA